MENKHSRPEEMLEQAIAQIRQETPDPAVEASAVQRVWTKLSPGTAPAAGPAPVERIRACADFQALIPAFLAGSLPPARTLLVQDHTRSCVACWKALQAARSPHRRPAAPIHSRRRVWRAKWAWGIAAALLVGLGVAWLERLLPAPPGPRATVQLADGALYRVIHGRVTPLASGDPVGEKEAIRTARGSRAVLRLLDGSLVELRERSEFSVIAKRKETRLHLARGSVIVQAAKRRAGHLRVATDDCLVSVTGTTFAVNRGTKGSRVSVLEGQVEVAQGRENQMLQAGDQFSTHSSLARVPVRDEISWSRDVEAHLALLAAIADVEKKLAAFRRPGLRYSTRLLELVPESTVLYAAFPNLSATLAEAHRLFRERIEENPVLRQWWRQHAEPSRGGPGLEEILERIRAFGDHLGDEIVVAVPADARGEPREPVFLAEVRRSGLRSFVEQEMARLSSSGDGQALRLLNETATAVETEGNSQGAVFVLVRNDLLAVSPDLTALQRVVARQASAAAGGFSPTPFHSRIAESYREGADWLFCADLERIIGSLTVEAGDERRQQAMRRTGLLDVKHLVIERKGSGDKTENRAVLAFSQPRRSVASWLAPPAPMGALQFISPEANFVAAFVVKSPSLMVEDLFQLLESLQVVWKELAQLESELGVSVRSDLAAPLGGEFVFAVDGPAIPTPSWKVVLEVYDPARFQQTLERLVDRANQEAAKRGRQPMRLDRDQVRSRRGLSPVVEQIFYKLTSPDESFAMHYVFANGYWVAAPSQALLLRALQYRETGYELARSAGFVSLLPQDGQPNFSAFTYLNLAPVLGALAEKAGGSLNRDQQQALTGVLKPTLLYAYAGEDRIVLANADSGGLSLSNLAALVGPGGLRQVLGGALGGGK